MAITPARSFLPGFRLMDGTDINEQLVDKVNDLITEIESVPADITAENVIFTATDTVTAAAGGGQTNATQLTGNVANVTVVATAADSVKLPLAVAGAVFFLTNSDASDSMQVFGAGTDTINGVATATGVAQAAGKSAVYYAVTSAPAGKWFRVLSA